MHTRSCNVVLYYSENKNEKSVYMCYKGNKKPQYQFKTALK